MQTVTHGSLFSGIGGFDLAASWMGWDNVFSCEKDRFCRNVLQYYWPNTKHYEDIYEFDATIYRGCIDVISGGFPCQPFSSAGKRKGTKDDRYLWPETRRIITEVRPKWIVLENVAGLFSILEPESLSEMEMQAVELFCQNDEQSPNPTILRLQRRVIGTIIEEIGSAGYLLPQLEDGTPIVLCIPACAVNAPHRRDRTWFVAHADIHYDCGRAGKNEGTDGREWVQKRYEIRNSGEPEDFFRPTADTECDHDFRAQRGVDAEKEGMEGIHRTENSTSRQPGRTDGDQYAGILPHKSAADPTGDGNRRRFLELDSEEKSERPGRLAAEPVDAGKSRHAAHPYSQGLQGSAESRKTEGSRPESKEQFTRFFQPDWDHFPTQSPLCGRDDGLPRKMDGISLRKWREESVKAYGNAIVPQVAFEIFRNLQQTGFDWEKK